MADGPLVGIIFHAPQNSLRICWRTPDEGTHRVESTGSALVSSRFVDKTVRFIRTVARTRDQRHSDRLADVAVPLDLRHQETKYMGGSMMELVRAKQDVVIIFPNADG